MSIAALKLKVMPKSVETNLEKLKSEIEKTVKKFDAKTHSIEKQEVAFGLKALIITLAWPEEKSTEEAVKEILHIQDVSSVDVIDYRRAFG